MESPRDRNLPVLTPREEIALREYLKDNFEKHQSVLSRTDQSNWTAFGRLGRKTKLAILSAILLSCITTLGLVRLLVLYILQAF